jgi:hypothetical protein
MIWHRRCLLLLLGLTIIPAWAGQSWSRCPSYQRGVTEGKCSTVAHPGKDPTTPEWNAIFALVAQGPNKWGKHGPAINPLKSGCTAGVTVPATFPCEILKAIAQKESNWHQFCKPTEPASEKGKPAQTLIARDCGYGASQVTSGMRQGETPAFDADKVASDPLYNVAVGASILAAKWQASRCLGNRDPRVIEHWYIALWRYNGYSYSNDPSNPIFSSTRGVYNPFLGGLAPYQERVFGIIEKMGRKWKSIALAYPRIEDVGGKNTTPVPRIECASPTDCTQRRPTHRTLCDLADADPLVATLAAADRAVGEGNGGRRDGGTLLGNAENPTGVGAAPARGAGQQASPDDNGCAGQCAFAGQRSPNATVIAVCLMVVALMVLRRPPRTKRQSKR